MFKLFPYNEQIQLRAQNCGSSIPWVNANGKSWEQEMAGLPEEEMCGNTAAQPVFPETKMSP